MASASFPTTPELSTKSALVSCEWLRQNLDRPNQVILDATFFCSDNNASPKKNSSYSIFQGHNYSTLMKLQTNSPLTHTLPGADQFAQ